MYDGIENQDSQIVMQRWVSRVDVCSCCVCLLGRVITVCMYRCFVNGVCMYGLAVVARCQCTKRHSPSCSLAFIERRGNEDVNHIRDRQTDRCMLIFIVDR